MWLKAESAASLVANSDTAPLSRLPAFKSRKQWQRCVYCIREPGVSRQALDDC